MSGKSGKDNQDPPPNPAVLEGLGAPRALVHLQTIAEELGKRLSARLRKFPDDVLPDEEWRETYRVYTQATVGILSETRHRVKLIDANRGASSIPDEQVDRELDEIAVRRLFNKMPAKVRKQMIELVETTPGIAPVVYSGRFEDSDPD